jgi:UDP-N-acetylmuramoylalanine--D-glutamate ligase
MMMKVRGDKVTVVGMGRTAVPLVRLLAREGAEPFVTELRDDESLQPYREALEALGVAYECGGHSPTAFEDAAVVIPSPGVSPAVAPIEEARARGAAVMGEMEFASQFCKAPVLAVTGTNGKTTTTELLRALIASCGVRVTLAGNNATPLSAAVLEDRAPDYLVLEVSSYQLETIETFRPRMAAVLNVTPDHLGRHGTVDAYAATKARIFENQQPGDVAIVNADDPRVCAMKPPAGVNLITFGMTSAADVRLVDGAFVAGDNVLARLNDMQLRGSHNASNVLAALAFMHAGGFDLGATRAGLRGFKGVEHRIEFVDEIDGIPYFNDSKSTNLDSLTVALESFQKPLVLIAGGRGKDGADYAGLRSLVGDRVVRLIAIGDEAPHIMKAFGDVVESAEAATMADAVQAAASVVRGGEVVLLSPGCASFDWYTDFEERGLDFKECVRMLREPARQ